MNPVLQSLLIYFLQLCTISVPSCQLTHCFRMQSQVILGFAPQTIAVTITIISISISISISIVIVAIILEAAHPISATFFPFLPFLSMPRIFDQPAPRSPISNISSLDNSSSGFLMFNQMINGKSNLSSDHFHFLFDRCPLLLPNYQDSSSGPYHLIYITRCKVKKWHVMMALFKSLELASIKWVVKFSLLQLFPILHAALSACYYLQLTTEVAVNNVQRFWATEPYPAAMVTSMVQTST